MNPKKSLLIIALLVFFLISAQGAQGEIPKTMSYRSSLIKPSGFPCPVGAYNIRFEIVDTNDVVLWQEEHIIEIEFFYLNVYEVLLGATNPIDLPFDEDYRIRVVDITTSPDYLIEEKPLASVGYAYRAEYCNFADTSIETGKVSEAENADYALEAGHALTADSATTAGDADTIDGKHADEILDTSADTQIKTGGLNIQGNVGIGTTMPGEKLEVVGGRGTFIGVSSNMPVDGISNLIGYSWKNLSRGDYWRFYLADPDAGSGVTPGSLEIWEYPNDGGDCCRARFRIKSSYGVSSWRQVIIDEKGIVRARAFDTGDIVFRKDGEKLWRMFEDENGLYLESLKTGETSRIFLEKDIKALEERLAKLEALLNINQ